MKNQIVIKKFAEIGNHKKEPKKISNEPQQNPMHLMANRAMLAMYDQLKLIF